MAGPRIVHFPFRHETTPPEFKAAFGETYRPLLIFRLINTENGQSQLFEGLVDTGAPYCLMPGWMGNAVGHDVSSNKCAAIPVNGVGGSAKKGWLHHRSRIDVMYRDARSGQPHFLPTIDCPVVFCPDYKPLKKGTSYRPYGLLGQYGFLSAYHLLVMQSEKRFALVIP